MKNNIICLVILIGFQYMNAQSFQETSRYAAKTEIKDDGSEFPSHVVSLLSMGEISEELATLTINNAELFEDIFITTLVDPGLEGVSEVIKMEVEYLSCCAEVDSYYYLVKENNDIIPLPHITNIYCNETNTDSQYTFPNQEYGLKGNIRETTTLRAKNTEVSEVHIKQNLNWENNEFYTPKNDALTSF